VSTSLRTEADSRLLLRAIEFDSYFVASGMSIFIERFLKMLQSRLVLARLQPDMYFKTQKCHNVSYPEAGDPKLATRKDTKIEEIGFFLGGGNRRREHPPPPILAKRIFFPLNSKEKVEFYVGYFTLLISPYCQARSGTSAQTISRNRQLPNPTSTTRRKTA
jgi:hypothetical protein